MFYSDLGCFSETSLQPSVSWRIYAWFSFEIQRWASAAWRCEPWEIRWNPLKVISTTLLIICANSPWCCYKQMKHYRVTASTASALTPAPARFIWIPIPPAEKVTDCSDLWLQIPAVFGSAIISQRIKTQYETCTHARTDVFPWPIVNLGSACRLSELCTRNSACPTVRLVCIDRTLSDSGAYCTPALQHKAAAAAAAESSKDVGSGGRWMSWVKLFLASCFCNTQPHFEHWFVKRSVRCMQISECSVLIHICWHFHGFDTAQVQRIKARGCNKRWLHLWWLVCVIICISSNCIAASALCCWFPARFN